MVNEGPALIQVLAFLPAAEHGVGEQRLGIKLVAYSKDAYGLRFDIEEGFLDFKPGGFQLESS